MRRVQKLACAAGVAAAVICATVQPAQAYTPTVKAHAVTMAVSGDSTYFIGGDGKIYLTGWDVQAGSGTRATPTPLAGLPSGVRAQSIAAGYHFALVLGSNGKVYGTGMNDGGQLTDTSADHSQGWKNTLTPLAGLPSGVSAKAVAAGQAFSLVLGSDGKVYGTGWNSNSELTTSMPVGANYKLAPLAGLPSGVRATAIDAGHFQTVVLASDGSVYGAGYSVRGSLTSKATVKQLTAFTGLPAGLSVKAVAASYENVVLLGSDGHVWVTGENEYGQLGLGTVDTNDHPLARRIPGIDQAVAIEAGHSSVLAVDQYGVVYGTGANYGQLSDIGSPVTVADALRTAPGQPSKARIVEVAGAGSDTLVRDADGVVLGVGYNGFYQLTGTGDRSELTALAGQRISAYKAPTVSGTAKVGSILTAKNGSWSVKPTACTYQWYRGSTAISHATAATYKLTSADKGHKIKVRVKGTRTSFTSGTAYSAATGTIG
ncbi:hypothetical protein [Streptomyces sp. H51]|uniref:hypothetical protein n=1 Tax=Streptomyces sp. H51 TaxID=3111770 RepID=UPI002D79F114|nr:hypothetical protein [Streptomyces sp. H51]